jgi:hypothetical protein
MGRPVTRQVGKSNLYLSDSHVCDNLSIQYYLQTLLFALFVLFVLFDYHL